MDNAYEQDLMISGIQHYGYCKRQWMLIHVEHIWNENLYTFHGNVVHERVDDPTFVETRHNTRKVRSIRVKSDDLGVYGVADLVEIVQVDEKQRLIIPYEYKAGKPKGDRWDDYQLCLVAMCLEEMMATHISYGYIFYHKIMRKIRVDFDEVLRGDVKRLIADMHNLYKRGETIIQFDSKKCPNCSLKSYCIPLRKKKKCLVTYYEDAIQEVKVEETFEHTLCDERGKGSTKKR